MTALRIGILGGSGQVGSALLKALNEDCGLIAFGICRNKMSAARVACLGMPVRIAQTDNAAHLAAATSDLDALVNCALPRYGPSKTFAENQRLANSLAATCAGKQLVHLSSVAVYGDFISGREVLFDSPKPDTAYGRQKLHMEYLLRKHAKKHSMKCTILRVGHVYGAGLRWSEIIFDLLNQEGFRLPFDGRLASNAIGITNLIAGIREVLSSKPCKTTLNLTDYPQTSWRDIFDLHSQASARPAVESLNMAESQRCFRERKKWAQTGMTARLVRETLAWIRHLPASFVASVPTLRATAQWCVERIGSEDLEAKLWAAYYRRLATRVKENVAPEILPVFLSEPVPGPCLNYRGRSLGEGLAALQDWHDAISAPVDALFANVLSKTRLADHATGSSQVVG